MKSWRFFLVLLGILFGITCFAVSELDLKLDDLVSGLTTKITEKINTLGQDKPRVAVMEFPDLNGTFSNLGSYVAEEVTTRLFNTNQFEVVERQLLEQVLREQKFNSSGLIDQNSAIELGKILGVKAIVTGTITDLGDCIKINARVIATETGSVFAAAAAEITIDERIGKLLSEKKLKETIPLVEPVLKEKEKEGITDQKVLNVTPEPKLVTNTPEPTSFSSGLEPSSASEVKTFKDPNLIYFDDFSNPADGWTEANNNDNSFSYQNNEYQIEISAKNRLVSSVPSFFVPESYGVQVDAHLNSIANGDYGLIFEKKAAMMGYVFLVNPGFQKYAVYTWKSGRWSELIPWKKSGVIRTGESNQLKVVKVGVRVRFYVNQKFVTETMISPSIWKGQLMVGLVLQSRKEIPAVAHFDNFQVTRVTPED